MKWGTLHLVKDFKYLGALFISDVMDERENDRLIDSVTVQ